MPFLSETASLTLASPRLSCCERFRTGRPRLARRHAVRDKLALTHLVKDVNKEPLLLRLHPSKLHTLFYSRCTSLHLVHICHLCIKARSAISAESSCRITRGYVSERSVQLPARHCTTFHGLEFKISATFTTASVLSDSKCFCLLLAQWDLILWSKATMQFNPSLEES